MQIQRENQFKHMLGVNNVRIQSVELWNEMYSDDTCAISQAQQLSRGNLSYRTVKIKCRGVQLEWDYFGAKIRYREWPQSGGTIVGMPVRANASFKVNGEALDYGEVYVVPYGEEGDYIVAKGTQALWIFLPSEEAGQMCLVPGQDMAKRVDVALLEKVLATCRKAAYYTGNWRPQILADLYPLLEPWRVRNHRYQGLGTASRHFKLFNRAEEIYASATSAKPITIKDITEILGVSRRTLFQAFQSSIGMPPASYQRLRRLNALHGLLTSGSASTHTVTELAMLSGFNHLGRMYVDYRNWYGETPRTTLLR